MSLSEKVHVCDECGYKTSRARQRRAYGDHASGRVILQRGLNNVVPMDCRERKLPSNEGLINKVD